MHGYDEKVFPLTAAQGRVLYHAERIFRSAGGPGCLAAQTWRDACAEAALPLMVDTWTLTQCVMGLTLIEWAARKHRMHLFRDCRTQWEQIAPPGVLDWVTDHWRGRDWDEWQRLRAVRESVERRRMRGVTPSGLYTVWAAGCELL
jgi:hypothetical protein